jgi:hypothetical protein
VLLQGLLKVDSDKFPFFTSLTSFLIIIITHGLLLNYESEVSQRGVNSP